MVVVVTPVRNLGHKDGESSALRLGLAPTKEGECYRPKQGLGMGLNRPAVARAWQTDATELRLARIDQGRVELRETENGSEFLTSRWR